MFTVGFLSVLGLSETLYNKELIELYQNKLSTIKIPNTKHNVNKEKVKRIYKNPTLPI